MAIGQLLVLCHADPRRYAHKHCHSSDVNDAVQESLLIISRNIKGLKAAGVRRAAYSISIASN